MTPPRHYWTMMVWREIRRSWTQFVAVFCMACMSVAAYAGLEGAWNGMRVNLDDFAESSNMADLWLTVSESDDAMVEAIRGLDDVSGVYVQRQVVAQVVDADGQTVWLDLMVLDDQPFWTVGGPELVEGEMLDFRGPGVWLNDRVASSLGLSPSDLVALRARAPLGLRQQDMLVRGLVMSSDRVYNVRASVLTMPDSTVYGYGYITTPSALELFGGYPIASTTVMVRTDGHQVDGVSSAIRELAGDRLVAMYDRDTNPAVSMAFQRVSTIRNLSILFSSLFVLVAVLAIYSATRRLVDAQAKQIGTMRALGFGKGQLIAHFASFGLTAGGIGVVVGLAVSPILSRIVLSSQRPQFEMPDWSVAYTPMPLVVASIVIASCVVGAGFAARSCTAGEPAELLRPGVPMGSRGTASPVNRLIGRASYPVRWAVRDALANPVRLFMGVAGVVGSLMLLFAGLGLPDTVSGQAADNYSEQQAPYHAQVVFTAGADPAMVEALPLGDDPQYLMQLSVGTEPSDGVDKVVTVLAPGDRFTLRGLGSAELDGDGFWVTRGSAKRLGLAPGDEVTLSPPMGMPAAAMTVDALTSRAAPQGFYTTRQAWEDAGWSFRPTAALVGEDADLAALQDSPFVGFIVTRETQYDNAMSLMGAMTGIFMILRVFAIVLTVVVLYSIGSLTFDERKRQYSTLKVLGLPNSELRRLSLIDNAALTVLGVVIGVPAGWWFLSMYTSQFNTNLMNYTTRITAVSIAIALALTIATSFLTTIMLGLRIGAVDVVEALKGVE